MADEDNQEQLYHLEKTVTNKSLHVDEAIRLADNLYIHGYRLDSLNICSIIHDLCDSNRFAEAHNQFLSSLSGYIFPHERTCNVIIAIARLIEYGRRPDATLRVAQRIIAVKPRYGALSKYGVVHYFDKGVIGGSGSITQDKVFDEMSNVRVLIGEVLHKREKMHQGKNVDDGFSFGQVIDSLCRYDRHHGAKRFKNDLYMMMKLGWCVPNADSYNSIIHGLTKTGENMRAYQLLGQAI
ncbi:hypothetical protein E3N88_02132 [Mikania micrantha]|uniref:Pentacotripeptide-repeat region of PRORP domain-containing protein n=1 Tax=Mikania micrantha TaxID=192012 RepID=A0A5N6Q4L2_9ASTR|nr:hypothetical protein E3N88_02132 [Mikania micrantha]